MRRNILSLILIILLGSIIHANTYIAEDYNCIINVMPDRDLQIRETFQYHFEDKPYTWVNRIIPERYTDGVAFISSNLSEPGGSSIPFQGETEYDDEELIVKWEFAPTLNRSMVFELEFMVYGVCYFKDNDLILSWQPLPSSHSFEIVQGKIDIILPSNVTEIRNVTEPVDPRVRVLKLSSIQVHTEKGYRLKYTWKLWKKAILDKMEHSPEEISVEEFDILFPYAMVLGFADRYHKFIKKLGKDLSESKLIKSFDLQEDFVVFIAWYVAIASSTGSTGTCTGTGAGAGGGSAFAG